MTYKTIIFDFDYTLADSSAGVIDCINYALARLKYPAVSPEKAKATIGLSLPDTLKSLTAGVGFSDEKATSFTRFFVEKADEVMVAKTVIFRDVPIVLKSLKEQGYQLGIVSTKYRYRIANVLKRDNLLDYFDVIVGGEDVLNHKPDPESLYLALDKLGADKESTLYAGDSLTDARAAQNARFNFAAVLNGVTRREDFEGYPVIVYLESLTEILTFLEGEGENQEIG